MPNKILFMKFKFKRCLKWIVDLRYLIMVTQNYKRNLHQYSQVPKLLL